MKLILLAGWLSVIASAHAQLAVAVSPVKITGSRAVVPLAMKNVFSEKIESARAVCFLLDEHGEMLANSSKWVIGGKASTALAPSTERTYEFVLQGARPFTTTNLTAKVSFTRLVLEGGRVVEPSKNVTVNSSKSSTKEKSP
jgi:hypothetical protein